jgi:DNA repair exonuclease SbcCD ATPase subunit
MLLLACAGLCALVAGCGGSASTDTSGNATVGVSTGDAAATLDQIATQAQTIVSTQIQAIASSTSTDEAAAKLMQARSQLDQLATQIDTVETDNESLAQARDRLHDALHELADQVGDWQTSVGEGDLQKAIQQVSSSQALADLRAAIQSVQAQAGG